MSVPITLSHRHYGIHKPVAEAEIPGELSDYATRFPPAVPAGVDEYAIDEDKLLAALPEGFLPAAPSRVLLTVDDAGGGTGQCGLSKFRNWAKYFDAYVLGIWTCPIPQPEPEADQGPTAFDLGMSVCRDLLRDLDDEPVWLEGHNPDDPLRRPIETTASGAHTSGSWCVKLVPTLDMVSVRADLKRWGPDMYDEAVLSPDAARSFRHLIFVRYPDDQNAITGSAYRAELRAAADKALAAIVSAKQAV